MKKIGWLVMVLIFILSVSAYCVAGDKAVEAKADVKVLTTP